MEAVQFNRTFYIYQKLNRFLLNGVVAVHVDIALRRPVLLAFRSVCCICRKNLSASDNTSTTLSVGTGLISSIAFDWIHNNLYWTDSSNDRIEVLGMAADDSGQHWERTLIDTGLDDPHAVVVDPRDRHR